MVQFMEAAMSAIATGPPSKMSVGQVRRTGNMRVLDKNEKSRMGVMQLRSTGLRNEWASTVTLGRG